MRTTKQLLEMLTAAFPPPQGAKHCVLVYEGKLHVVIAGGAPKNEFQHITLEDEDLDRQADSILADIAALLAARLENN